jgi:hypothetical protein
MDSVRANSPSRLLPRVSLAWQAARRVLARSLRGDVLSKDKYAAFISYRHAEPDRRWAVWLHSALESFVIPHRLRSGPDHRRIGRVFRDEEELAASPHLSADIKDALNRSDWLIVVCSPRAVQSEWVSAEVEHFKELRRGNRILALLIEGEPAQSFPTALYDIRSSVSDETLAQDEPLAADVRRSGETDPRKVSRWAKLRLLATILGCKFDDLRQREQERRNRWLALVATIASIGFFVVASLAIAAFLEKTIADQKTIEATTNEKRARNSAEKARAAEQVANENERQARAAEQTAIANESRALTGLSQSASLGGYYTDAVKLALAAWPRSGADTRPMLSRTIDALGQALAGRWRLFRRWSRRARSTPWRSVRTASGSPWYLAM